MKLPLDQRSAIANQVIGPAWNCSYWSRDEQLFACAEGWCLTVYKQRERIVCWRAPVPNDEPEFASDQEALAYVTQRAEQGSPLHCRALILHTSCVLRNGDAEQVRA